MLRSLESMMDLYIQFKVKAQIKIKIKFQYIQTIFKYKPTLEKSSMKSKIEFKYDIRKQNVKYPSYLENMKAKSKQLYFTKKNIQSLIKSTLQK